MFTTEVIVATILVTLTCGSATIFGIRQIRTLWWPASSGDDGEMLRRSAIRRLIVSVCLCVAGILIATTYLSGLAQEMSQLAEQEEPRVLTAEQRSAIRAFTILWIVALLLVGTAVLLIGYDMFKVRRHWTGRLDRLREDRRAMLERQLGRLRAERRYTNGQHDE
jgi:hypothetical protein